ncbi:hypothetical protein ACKFKF_04210 [Phormidesmis sp. 146-12]
MNKIDDCLVASPPKSPILGDFEKADILEFKAVSRFKVRQIWGVYGAEAELNDAKPRELQVV